MENIVFNNITFNQAGNLLLFQQQLSNYLSISNLTISSVYNAGIMLKSSNKLNINLPVKVAIQSLTASSNKFDMNSFITVSDNAILNITGSTISRCSTSGSGASLSAIAPYSIVNIDSSTIRSNTAAQGGAFYADNYGVIRVYNSLIQRNNASISGVIWLTNNGRFEFYGCNITQNTAIDAPIARLFDSTYFSIINNCVISNNTIGSLNGSNTYPIQLISSSILITNSTDIFGQFSILNAFLSTVTLENSIIENCEFDDAAFNIIGTIFTISNIQLDSDTIYSDNSLNSLANAKLIQYILQISMYCQVYISNVTYTNSNLALVLIQQSSSIISDLSVSSVISNGLIKIENSQNSTIMNVNINSYISRNPISFTNSYSYLIENITATGVNGIVIRFTGCKVFKINNVNIFNINNKVMYFKDSQITLMSNLTIYNNALSSYAAASLATKTINGIIYFRNSNSTIKDSNFTNNSCTNGCAVYYFCQGSKICVNSIENSSVSKSSATISGGAIYYDTYRPNIKNMIFTNNSASYGNNIASYAVRVMVENSTDFAINLNNIASGQVIPDKLVLKVVDYDNQTIPSIGSITIRDASSNTKVLGATNANIINGVGTFSSIIFQAKPGSKNVSFSVNSNLIRKSIIFKQFQKTSIQTPIIVNFRYCQPGEISSNSQCVVCAEGSYSLNWNSTICEFCPSRATCLGGTQIFVDAGYWRSSTNSTHIVSCIRADACQGEYHPENFYPVKCSDGYEGVLCSSCVFVNGTKYERSSSFECTKCPNPIYNILRLIGFIFLVSLFFIIMIVVGIKKKNENQQSILLRIIANYFQLITAAMSFNLKFPSALSDAFLPAEKVGSSTEAFLSFDCFLSDSNVITFTPNIAIFKVFLTGLLPIFLLFVGLLFWSIAYFIPVRIFKDFKRNLCITTIVILYLLHPMLTKVGLEMFQCIEVDKNKSQARINLDFECFSTDHMKWCAFFGVPIVVFWSIGSPILIFWIMFKNRHSLQEPKVQRYLLMMYQGLKDKVFYWELINTMRKIIMIGINAFLSTLPLIYSASSAVIVLVGLMRLQLKLQPYKKELNNKLEMEAMTAGAATLFCGVLFVSDSQDFSILTSIILTVIIIINIKFFLMWTLCMTHTLINRHEIFRSLFNILAIATCSRRLAVKINEEFESSKFDSKTNNAEESNPSTAKKYIVNLQLSKSKNSSHQGVNEKLPVSFPKAAKDRKMQKKVKRKLIQFKHVDPVPNNKFDKSVRVTFERALDSTARGQETGDRMQSIYSNKAKKSHYDSRASRLKIIEDVSKESSCNLGSKNQNESSLDFIGNIPEDLNMSRISNFSKFKKNIEMYEITLK